MSLHRNHGAPDKATSRQTLFGPARPNLGCVRPNLGPVRPNLGRVRPNLGRVQPNAGPVRQNAGCVRPNLGSVQPTLASVRPCLGCVRPIRSAKFGSRSTKFGLSSDKVGRVRPNLDCVPNSPEFELRPNVWPRLANFRLRCLPVSTESGLISAAFGLVSCIFRLVLVPWRCSGIFHAPAGGILPNMAGADPNFGHIWRELVNFGPNLAQLGSPPTHCCQKLPKCASCMAIGLYRFEFGQCSTIFEQISPVLDIIGPTLANK